MTGVSERTEMLVGALVVLLLAAVLGLSYGDRGRTAGGAGLILTADFRNADGLDVGAQVRLAGMPVGAVTAHRLSDDYRVEVTMALDPAAQIPLDSSASIHTDGLFGRKYIEIEPGGAFDMLTNGDTFEFTEDALQIDDLLDRILALARARAGRIGDASDGDDRGDD